MLFFLSSFEDVFGLPIWVGYAFFFILGLAVGSFLNVVIYRVPLRKSVVFPSSKCTNCENRINFYDNIPLISWFILKGKCRSCKIPISFRYPSVEFLLGAAFVLIFWKVGFSVFLPVVLIFTSFMVCLIFIDAENMILPDAITYPAFFFAIIVRVAYPSVFGATIYFQDLKHYPLTLFKEFPIWLVSLIGAIFGGLVGGGSLWLVGVIWKRLRGVDAMGLGDVKMMFGVGALLGWRLALLSIFIGALTGAVAGIALIAKQKDKDFQTQIPFGIFLGIGSIISLLFGEILTAWYMENLILN